MGKPVSYFGISCSGKPAPVTEPADRSLKSWLTRLKIAVSSSLETISKKFVPKKFGKDCPVGEY
jgi:hypothetical protein